MKRVLIANRGEIACRVIRSCRALGLETVAVCSEADRDAMHVALADQSVMIGPPRAQQSYLNVPALLDAMRETVADAVHPGYGFLAENAAFATAVHDAGAIWVGPTPHSITEMGDKERARRLAEAAGVPVLAGSQRIAAVPAVDVAAVDVAAIDVAAIDVAAIAEAVGYPLLVKAAGGGGGIGMQRVDDPSKLARAVASTQALAERAFGDSTVYLEHYVTRARHIEIQVFGFGDGRVVHLFERECSIQRRFQKIIEESPAPGIDPALLDRMANAATALAARVRYSGAGTVEFVFDDVARSFHFLEMNTRIQVEHPVTEMTTGIDLVALQLRLARGDDLSALTQERIERRGHAIECRLYAENPNKNFMPAPGRLDVLEFPAEGEGRRIDTGVRQGDQITPWYDPMIAKIIGGGASRDAAIERSLELLDSVRIEGLQTNLRFLRQVLRHPSFRAGALHTHFVDAHRDQLLAD